MMTLVEEADLADTIRTIFTGFLEQCPEFEQDISKAISELLRLGNILRDVDDVIETQSGPLRGDVNSSLEHAHDGVTFALRDIWMEIGRMGNGSRHLISVDYKTSWLMIVKDCLEKGNSSVHGRLEIWRKQLESVYSLLDRSPKSNNQLAAFSRAPARIQPPPIRFDRTMYQPKPLSPGGLPPLANLKVSENPPSKKPSYERERPTSPTASTTSSRDAFQAIWAPTPPQSPTATFSSTSKLSSIPSIDNDSNHWAKQVFKHASSTLLPRSLEATRYHERTGIKELAFPGEEYDVVLTFEYPEGLRLSFYCRPSDYRAKLVAEYRDYRGRKDFACQNLESLVIYRDGSILRICKIKSSGKPVPWASLKFATVERLVLFACTFIAMRSQSVGQTSGSIQDEELRGETSEFGGTIIDSEFKHRLRVYWDKATGAVRLQASVCGGELDRTPVWTAFITHTMMSPEWCERVEKRTVCLGELRPHIFSSRYQPHYTPNGAFELQFERKDEALDFMECMSIIRNERRRK